MEKWIITAETTCDIPAAYLEKYGIKLIPITVIVDGKEYKDGVDIDPEHLFEYVKQSGELPKTAALSVAEYEEFFTEVKKNADRIMHFSISSKASSTYYNAVKAAEEFEGISVIDSKCLTTGEAALMFRAHEMLTAGEDFDEVYNKMIALTEKVQTSFVLDTLDNLYKGGRCSSMALLGSKILKIHPAICEKDGQLVVKKKYMGNLSRSIVQYITDLAQEYPSYDKRRCFITHSPFEDRSLVDMAIAKVKELFDFEEVIETEAGATVSTHCGKNTVGLLFIAE